MLAADTLSTPANSPVSQDATLIEVALPRPLSTTFRYALTAEMGERVEPGTRVMVQLRGRREIGICLGPADAAGLRAPARPLLELLDDAPVISEPVLHACRWIADYYIAPIGLVLRAALPALLTGVSRPRPNPKTRRMISLDADIPSLLRRDEIFGRAGRQRELFELLESMGGRSSAEHLTSQLGFSESVLRGLVKRGVATVQDEVAVRDPFADRAIPAAPAHDPTPAQRAAVAALTSAAAGDVALLHGITGSGKTLVYLELLKDVVGRRGQGAIVLVPEIALTPQTVDRFRAVFRDTVAVLHSALGEGERYDAWLALRRGEKRIAIGARSAIFAPVADLGAIIVDEEHEASYKQSDTPRYHAREVAIVRAARAGAVVVLGSATPSLESWSNAQSGKYRLISLPDRVGGSRLPAVEVVDLRRVPGDGQSRGSAPSPTDPFRRVISAPLEEHLRDRLDRREQSILLLNRRGYASFLQCGSCGDVVVCPDCSITLTYHRSPEGLVCHYCMRKEGVRTECARCGGSMLRQRGVGTQQVERLLAERLPAARIARMDMDTTSAKWAHAEILDRVASGEVDILLGTQMIAKGLDFPNVTLVGVVDADVGINLPDFRASERCFQLLSQVAGRAGRGPKGGRVIIQTRVPEHHAVRCAVEHDYEAFLGAELPGRLEPAYPPSVRLVNVVLSGTEREATADLALAAGEWLRRLARRAGGGTSVEVIGPAPCAVERIRSRWRWHMLLRSRHAGELTRIGHYMQRRFDIPPGAGLRLAIDRDPVSLM
ncbi:MAG: replication restart helicase PriA [Gemmatimonadaceae bacterium]